MAGCSHSFVDLIPAWLLVKFYLKMLPDGEPVQLTHDNLDKMSPVSTRRLPHRLYREWVQHVGCACGERPASRLAHERLRSRVARQTAAAVLGDQERHPHGDRRLRRNARRGARRVPTRQRTRHGAPVLPVPRRQGIARGRDGAGRMAPVPAGAPRWSLPKPSCGPPRRPMHVRGMVTRWEMDVPSRRRAQPAVFTPGGSAIRMGSPNRSLPGRVRKKASPCFRTGALSSPPWHRGRAWCGCTMAGGDRQVSVEGYSFDSQTDSRWKTGVLSDLEGRPHDV